MMTYKMTFAVCALVASAATADVTLKGIFTDNMVLQRGKPIPVSGTAAPGETVTVSYGARKVTANASADGRFRVVLPALEVEKTGRDFTVAGKNTLTLTNVVVGDVWLVSGQSNSEMSFRWGIINGKEEMAKAKDYPNIRQIKFRHQCSAFPLKDRPCNQGGWKVATERTLPDITAEGYFMAREINARTGIPIGILDDNWSGCAIEPFVCEEGLRLVPEFAQEADRLANVRKSIIAWCEKVIAGKATGDYGAAGEMPAAPLWTSQHNAMIEPIVDFPICGATWYQGCANGGDGMIYAKKLEALISGWRMKWGYDFPFYIVQLASFTAKTTDPEGGNGYARIRNAMRVAAQTIPRT